MKRVLVVEPLLGDAGHPHLTARQVLVVVDDVWVVDDAHLLLEALHIVVGEQLRAVLPQPEPTLPLHGPATRRRWPVHLYEPRLEVRTADPGHHHDQVEVHADIIWLWVVVGVHPEEVSEGVREQQKHERKKA
jgi:hypothetical protein